MDMFNTLLNKFLPADIDRNNCCTYTERMVVSLLGLTVDYPKQYANRFTIVHLTRSAQTRSILFDTLFGPIHRQNLLIKFI